MKYSVRFGSNLGMMGHSGNWEEREYISLWQAYNDWYNAVQNEVEFARLTDPNGVILADWMHYYSESEGRNIREERLAPELLAMLKKKGEHADLAYWQQRQSQGNPQDPWSVENRQRWERETGDSINSPGGAQRFVEWVHRKAQGNPQGYQQYYGKSARWLQSPRPLTPQETVMAIIRHKTTGTVGTISGKSGGGFVVFVPAEGKILRMLFVQTDQWEVIGRER